MISRVYQTSKRLPCLFVFRQTRPQVKETASTAVYVLLLLMILSGGDKVRLKVRMYCCVGITEAVPTASTWLKECTAWCACHKKGGFAGSRQVSTVGGGVGPAAMGRGFTAWEQSTAGGTRWGLQPGAGVLQRGGFLQPGGGPQPGGIHSLGGSTAW